jgi:prophage antirepressor-like protein
MKNVDKEDKKQLNKMDISFEISQQPSSIYINESGLYSLLFSSRTKKAKKFVKWIKNDVLPKTKFLLKSYKKSYAFFIMFYH